MDNKANKTPFQKKKAKARQAAFIDEETSDGESTYEDPEIEAWVRKGQTLRTEDKETIVHHVWEAETGMLVGPEADF